MTVEPITSAQAARDYLAQAVNPTLLKGLTELCRQKPQNAVVSICLHRLCSLYLTSIGLELCNLLFGVKGKKVKVWTLVIAPLT